jgi:large subunit ribosomal protein L29
MKVTELRNLSKEELLNKERELKLELSKLNVQRYGASVEKPHLFGALKKDIARIKTLLRETKQKDLWEKPKN